MFIDLVMPSDYLILYHPLLFLTSIFPSIRVFSELFLCISWQKYHSLILSISPFNEYSGLVSCRLDWLDLLAVQGILKRLLQHHSSKASVSWCSTFFMIQLSHPYMITGKNIALTIRTFVSKVMSLLFNMLSRFVLVFLLSSKHLLISWLQSLFVTASTFPPFIYQEVMGLDATILVFLNGEFKANFFTLIAPSSRSSLVSLHFLSLE